MAGGSSAETLSMKGSVSLAEQQQQLAAAAAPPLVCVECGRPVALLFREYNKGNIRLGRCVSASLAITTRSTAVLLRLPLYRHRAPWSMDLEPGLLV